MFNWKRGEGVPLIEWYAYAVTGGFIVYVVIHWIG